MYAAIRRGKVYVQGGPCTSVDEVARRIQDGVMSTLRNLPGFIAYSFVKLGDDEELSISLFETQEEAEESNRLSIEWARRNLADCLPAPLQTSEGEVLIHVAK